MLWLYITISAYLLFAFANIGDKLMVSRYQTKPIVYAFYVGILGVFVLFLIPLGVIIPGPIHAFWALVGGLAFVLALLFMYQALHIGETTRAITILGGTSPIFTFLFSTFFIPEKLNSRELLAFGLLVLAIIVIAWPPREHESKKTHHIQTRFSLEAGVFFALSYVLAKYAYANQPFISGFFWIRVGGVLTALIILALPKYRRQIFEDLQRPKKKRKAGLLLAVQIFGGMGVIGQNIALALTSASLVNALQAIQYAFVFILTFLLGKKIHQLKEKLTHAQIIQKISAIILIGVGLYLLTQK
jgi:drug/metabolite transporter (DMT)-like permease